MIETNSLQMFEIKKLEMQKEGKIPWDRERRVSVSSSGLRPDLKHQVIDFDRMVGSQSYLLSYGR